MATPCSYSGCNKVFRSVKEMTRHKIQDPDHEYCSRCDLDFDTDEEKFLHMLQSPRHIVCPHCADEFKSEGGLTLHLRQSHRANAEIACVGCKKMFSQAGHYMRHIEKGDCQILSRQEFEQQRAQKQLIKDAFQMSLNAEDNEEYVAVSTTVGSTGDTEDGGVSLDLMDSDNMPLPSTAQNSDVPNLLDDRRNERTADSSSSPRPYQRQYTTERQDWPDLGGPAYKKDAKPATSDDDLIDMDSRISRGPIYKWTKSAGIDTAKRLFPEAKASPSKSVIDQNAQADNQSVASTTTWQNVSDTGFGNAPPAPSTTSTTATNRYDVWNFHDGILGKFVCPARHCARQFDTAKDFQAHLIGPAHTGGSARCPMCFRIFRSTHALVSHCESSTVRCKINMSANYNQILREITGDLIGTKGHREDGSAWYVADEDVLPKRGERPAGMDRGIKW